MPRDQETSVGPDPATSDDPLFREPDDQRGDQALRGHGDPLRDPLTGGDDTAGDTPIGDRVGTGRHAGAGADEPSDTPGEWVAGSKGPDHVAGQNGSVVPDQPGEPAVERIDPATGDPVTTGAEASGATAVSDISDVPSSSGTSEAPSNTAIPATSAAPAATEDTSDLRTTRDPEVAPDAVLTGDDGGPSDPDAAAATATTGTTDDPEVTPADGIPAAGTATDPAAGTADPAATTATTPAAPVPGAPGTGQTTGVEAASAALVAHGSELHDDWARIQSSFVDDPRGAVSQAADLVSQVTSSLVSALQEREQTLRGAWDGQGGQGADTENLRNALRDYRAFFEMLTKI